MNKADLELMLKLMSAAKPAPIAPVLPISPSEYNKGSENIVGMAKDIEYLRKAVETISTDLKKITETHVTIVDFNDHTKMSDKTHTDFETRLREQSTRQTQILTFGSIVIFLTTVAQFILRLYGH